MTTIEIVLGDITTQEVDAIVTAANGQQAAAIAVHTIRSTPTKVSRVQLVAFDQTTRELLQAAFSS